MNTTTPASVTAPILSLCRKVTAKSLPVFVNVRPLPEAAVNQCFFNVSDHVRSSGGSPVYGWTVWEWPGLYVEAEHHAVWRDDDGGLVDVTPKSNNEHRILFLPDPKARFYVNNPKWRDNVRLPVVSDTRVSRFLTACSDYQKFELRHSIAVGRIREIRIPGHLKQRFASLVTARNEAMRDLMVLIDA